MTTNRTAQPVYATKTEINTQPLADFFHEHNPDMDKGAPCVVRGDWILNIPPVYEVTERGRGSCALLGQYWYSRKLNAFVYRPNFTTAGHIPQPPAEWITANTPIVRWIEPESNTEAAQQSAAELEQADDAPSPAHMAMMAADNAANARRDAEAAEWLDNLMAKTSQPSMFAATNADLPLFSGTAPRAHVSPFVESEVSAERQPRLF